MTEENQSKVGATPVKISRRAFLVRAGVGAAALAGLGAGGGYWFLQGWEPTPRTTFTNPYVLPADVAALPEAIDPAALRRDTEALSAIAPRHGGTPGELAARQWVLERFQAVGLANARLDPFVYPRWTCAGSSLTLADAPLLELEHLLLNGSGSTPSEGVTALLLDVGTAGDADYARFRDAELRGRIHLARSSILHRRQACINAATHGAAALIIVYEDTDTQGRTLLPAGTGEVFSRIPTFSVAAETGEKLWQAARQGTPVKAWAETRYTLARAAHVVAELPGADDTEYIALLAHYDAWHTGAADNAAAVAALLALGRAWQGRRPRRTIRFISPTAEEEGLMGTIASIALHTRTTKLHCRGAITPDPVGAPCPSLWIAGWPPEARVWARDIGAQMGFEAATGIPLEVREAAFYSDQWPYHALLKLPGLVVSSFPYRYYHTPYDTPDTLDYELARWQTAFTGALTLGMAG